MGDCLAKVRGLLVCVVDYARVEGFKVDAGWGSEGVEVAYYGVEVVLFLVSESGPGVSGGDGDLRKCWGAWWLVKFRIACLRRRRLLLLDTL